PVYPGRADRTSVRSTVRKPASGAAPGPVGGTCAQPCADRIEQHVFPGALEVLLAFDDARAVAPREEVAVPFVPPVEPLRIDAVEPLHARGEVRRRAADDDVVVRSHEAHGM